MSKTRAQQAIAAGVTPYWAYECYAYEYRPAEPMTDAEIRAKLLAKGYAPEYLDQLEKRGQ